MSNKEIIENYLFGNNYLENHVRPPMAFEILGKTLTDKNINSAIDKLKKRLDFEIDVSYTRADANTLILRIDGTDYEITN